MASSGKVFSMEEVEKHDSKESCWFVVDGRVYDATPFLKEHPGKSRESVHTCWPGFVLRPAIVYAARVSGVSAAKQQHGRPACPSLLGGLISSSCSYRRLITRRLLSPERLPRCCFLHPLGGDASLPPFPGMLQVPWLGRTFQLLFSQWLDLLSGPAVPCRWRRQHLAGGRHRRQ